MATVNPVQAVTYDLAASNNPIDFGTSTKIDVANGDDAVYGGPGTAWSVTNAGSIIGSEFVDDLFPYVTGTAVDMAAGGAVDNLAGARIIGGEVGILITGGPGSVENQGGVFGDTSADVGQADVAGGFEAGVPAATDANPPARRANVSTHGDIYIEPTAVGVDLVAGGSVTNGAGGAIGGDRDGVFIAGASASVTNQGAISGRYAIYLEASGATAENLATGALDGGAAGVQINGSEASVGNAGYIHAYGENIEGMVVPDGIGVSVVGGGAVTNQGKITAVGDGVELELVNGAGSVDNAAGATIYGKAYSQHGYGVLITGTDGQSASVTDAGAISGAAASVMFENNGADTLTLQTGATLSGPAIGGAASGATNTLVLQGSGATSNVFEDFNDIQVDSGASWVLAGVSTFDADVAINGALTIAGGLGSALRIDGGSGDLTLNGFASAWDTLSAERAAITLDGARASIVGCGDSIFASGALASLYDTSGDWDGVNASAATLYLTDAQASVSGGGDSLYLLGASGDAASLYDTQGVWDAVGGDDATIYLTDAQASVTGGADTLYLLGAANDAVSLYGGGNAWDTIVGDDATIYLTDSKAVVAGGGNTLRLLGLSGDAAGLDDTRGDWDAVGADDATIYLTDAQASVSGGGDHISAFGAGAAVSLYATGSNPDAVGGSNTTVYLTNASATLAGSDDAIDFRGDSSVTLSGGGTLLDFARGFVGADVVGGFDASDALEFSAAEFANFAALKAHLSQSGANAVISGGSAGATITLTDVAASSLTAAEFRFV